MKKSLATFVIAAVLVVIFVLLLFTFQVRQSEVAVVTTFGKPTSDITEPGLYFKWPWPVQQVYQFDQRVQTFEDKFSERPTADSALLLSSVYVGWKISDAKAFFPKFPGGSVAAAQRQLEDIVGSAKAAVVGNHNLADFVNANPQDLKFDQIEGEIKDAVQAKLATNNYGITVEFLGLQKLGLPENVTQAVFDRMKSERNKYISEAQFKGEEEAAKIKSSAEREASDTINNAKAVATRIQGEGEAEAVKSLKVFQENPDLAVFQLRLAALKESLNQKSTLILDERTPPFDLFRNLPAAPATNP
jgi:membrane protease subunit HflC